MVSTYVFAAHSIWATDLCGELGSVEADLNHVVEQSKERSQRERCHEDGDKPILDYCTHTYTLFVNCSLSMYTLGAGACVCACLTHSSPCIPG